MTHPRAGGMERSTALPCTVRAFEHEEIFAKVSGYLRMTVDIGSPVKKGQVLAVIEAPEYDKEVLQAAATLEQVRARSAKWKPTWMPPRPIRLPPPSSLRSVTRKCGGPSPRSTTAASNTIATRSWQN